MNMRPMQAEEMPKLATVFKEVLLPAAPDCPDPYSR